MFILLSGIDAGIHGKVLSSVGSHREAVCQRCCEGFIWNHDPKYRNPPKKKIFDLSDVVVGGH